MTKHQVRYTEPPEVYNDPDYLRYCAGEIERKPEWGIATFENMPSYSELTNPENYDENGEWKGSKMVSNKNALKKKEVERTGKNEIVYHAVSICPVVEKDVVVFRIMKIGFTITGKCVTIEEVKRAKDEASAISKFQMVIDQEGSLNIKNIRELVKTVKEDNEKKADE